MAAGGDLVVVPASSPLDLVVADPVVGPAGKAPVADGWRHRDRVAVVGELPCCWPQRESDLVGAPAAAEVQSGPVRHGHVQNPRLELVGCFVDELVSKPRHPHLRASPSSSSWMIGSALTMWFV